MDRKLKESDWKTFRRRVPQWRERYLRRKNEEVAGLLTSTVGTPTERFWEAKEQMEAEARILVECLDGHSRSKMSWYFLLMYRHGLIGAEDLAGFSAEVREGVLAWFEEAGR